MAPLGLAGALLLIGAPTNVAVHGAAAADSCPVSKTSLHPVPGRPSFNVGNARIAVALPEGARLVAVPDGRAGWASIQSNGWIRAKLGWFTSRGAPTIAGHRTDGVGRPVRASVGELSGTSAGTFYPSVLYFPSFGCWRITARAGNAHLTATVDVVRSAPSSRRLG